MMRVGIAVFAYNRSRHLAEVLTGLKKNQGINKLYIFQDGLKCEEHRLEWEKTKAVIEAVDWCEKVYRLSSYNKGLAVSLVDGINAVFEENDAVIVLEDDCVPTANFISFMVQCFEKYEDDERVYCVSGYNWPIHIEKSQWDVYGCGRISSWGWGTWKDRWQVYKKDYEMIKRMKQDEIMSRKLAMWGQDLEDMLVGNVRGSVDSWAVFWALSVIAQNGICVNPYRSFIRNIGMDGSGMHCGVTERFDVVCIDEGQKEFDLPDNIEITKTVVKAFAPLYGSYTASNESDCVKEKILVYGTGKFFMQNEEKINQDYYIEKFVDTYKKGFLYGKEIIKPDKVKDCVFDKIIIMIQDVQECIHIVKDLLAYGIEYQKIFLGIALYGKERLFDNVALQSDGSLLLTKRGIKLKAHSKDEYNNVREVFADQIYHYFISNEKKDVVIDIGMNIGDAVLYFLNDVKVEKIYAYEPFQKTYVAAEENLAINDCIDDRVELFSYGISNKNDRREIMFNCDMTCGQSTMSDMREIAYGKYQKMGLVKFEQEEKEWIEVRDAVEVFLPIIETHSQCNIILKMDCEGEEYGIIERLAEERLLERFLFIMLEWHYRGKHSLLQHLKNAGFSYWCIDKGKDMGMIYAYRQEI